MASSTLAICSKSPFHPLPNSNFKAAFFNVAPGRHNVALFTTHDSCKRLSCVNQPIGKDHRSSLKPVTAVRSGSETTVEDSEEAEYTLPLRNAKIVVESQEADKMQLRVDLTGEQTKKAFNVIFSRLYRSAPPTPRVYRPKNGKMSKIPKGIFLKILGKDSVLKYVMRQVVTSSVANYMKKTNPNVKGFRIISLNQTEEELNESFLPGNEFGFSVEFEILND